jgi:hypothetical protein
MDLKPFAGLRKGWRIGHPSNPCVDAQLRG